MSTTRNYIRRSRQQGVEMIELQPGSSLSAPKFCEQAGGEPVSCHRTPQLRYYRVIHWPLV